MVCGVPKNTERGEVPTKGHLVHRHWPLKLHLGQPCALDTYPPGSKDPSVVGPSPNRKSKREPHLPSAPIRLGRVSLEWTEKLVPLGHRDVPWDTGTPGPEAHTSRRPLSPPQPLPCSKVPAGTSPPDGPAGTHCVQFPDRSPLGNLSLTPVEPP